MAAAKRSNKAKKPVTKVTDARVRKGKVKPSDLKDLKKLGHIASLLEPLHAIGAARDKAGNRSLHMDQYCLLVLMWIFNPVIDSMRGMQQASELDVVRKRLGVGRASLGSLSESVTVFDPEPLAAIAAELGDKLPDRTPEKFHHVNKKITAVDGSVFKVLAQVGQLAWVPTGGGKSSCGYRLHAQFEVFKGIPNRIDLTGSKPKGDADERVVLEKTVEPDRCYLVDRGYQKYTLWNVINAKDSQYVCRLFDSAKWEVKSENELSDEAKAKNIVSDQIVRFGTENSRTPPPDHVTRVVVVKVKPHDSRKAKNAQCGPSSDGYLRIVTNNLEVPAEIIAALYELRWTIELYFRIIKQLLGCRHLLSHNPAGATIQMYMAIIACIMIMAISGKQPTKRTFEMITFYFLGWASLDELEAHIKKLQPSAD
ncbi:IS4 family transposase [Rhodopirellula bahusiensis]|uniref:IS4 family transposase n=1 Tax=Rhodopirellula bahusiensis TaxID=2014065 RepID=UPI00326553CA